jgi:hypothetical protein
MVLPMKTPSLAVEHAKRIIDHCWALACCQGDAIDRLERWAEIRNSDRFCPHGFTARQRATVQRRVLAAYLRAIGRA